MLIIIILPLRYTLYNTTYYDSEFEKNNVYDNIDKSKADNIISNLLSYFKGEANLQYFSDREQSHLEDVKNLLGTFFTILSIAVAILIITLTTLFFVNREEFLDNLFKQLFLGGLSSFALLALLFLASLNFSMTFEGFHKLFFPQGNYSFAPNSLLITLFPTVFFKNFFIKILLNSLLLSFVVMMPQFVWNKLNQA